ncbi:MAG: DUF5674 family protein [Pseudanabaena sp. CAN_BIN31]|nr:DUF5674 family protein [Pseudanabaena sp. CAN_BIN31]
MIYLICDRATQEQIDEMQQELGEYIKLAVDIEREILAGGGEFHADCESILLEDGSEQQNIWGADWYPDAQEVTYESLINIRPKQGNRTLEVLIPDVRTKIEEIAKNLLSNL